MPLAKLTDTQRKFLEEYKSKHDIIYPIKVSESEAFLRRKGKILDALDAVPTFATQNLRQAVVAADGKADVGEFKEAHTALEPVKVAAQQLAASYDPTNDLQTIGQVLQDHLKRAKAAVAEIAAARLTHRDTASPAEEKVAIDKLLIKTIAFLKTADQELSDISFRLTEVTRCCKLSAHQQQAIALATTLKTETAGASVIMKSPQTYYSPDEARNSLAAARDQQLKELDTYNQRKDQVLALMQKFSQRSVTAPMRQSLIDADNAAKKRDYGTAFNSLQTALTGATALASSYQPATDLKQLDAELTTFLGKAKAAAAEVGKVREEYKLSVAGDAAELALIDAKIPLATAFLPNAGADYKRLSEDLNDVNRFCKSGPDPSYASTLIYNLRTGMEAEAIGALLKPSGEFYALPELRLSLVAAKAGPAVASKLAAEKNADAKALASAARIHQAGTVKQMQIVPRANIDAKLTTRLAAVPTGQLPRDQMLKTAATAASQVFQQILQGTNDKAERMDLMLRIATDDLDGLLKSSMPGVNWGADPKLLGELAEATRKDLANVIPNRVVGSGNQETAIIGGESYDFKQELGRGGLGIAKLFESKKDKSKQLVLKEPQTRANKDIPTDIQYQMVMASNREMANELRAHLQASQSNHPNVLKLEDLCIGPDGRVRAVMELAAGGDLQKLHRLLEALSDLGVLPQAARAAVERDMAAQMLSGIAAMHGAGVIHHDLKGENVFLKADGTVQIADFGSGIAMTAQGKTPPQVTREIGTTEAYAPGVSPKKEHDEAFDIFTVGKILERDVGIPEKPGSVASSADRLREALTRSDADKRADLEAAAKTAYISEVPGFRNTPEYKDLLKEVMAARSTALGKFLKARFRLVHSLDICRCQALGAAMEPINLLAPGAKYAELSNICIPLTIAANDYYEAVIRDISPLSAKNFSGTVAEAEAARVKWVVKLQTYASKLPEELAKHKDRVRQFVSKYQEVLGSVDWDAVRRAMGGTKLADKQRQQAIEGLAKAEMRLYGVLDAFGEVAPPIQELVRAMLALVQAKSLLPDESGEFWTIFKAGRKFIEARAT